MSKGWETAHGFAWQPEDSQCTIQVARTASIYGMGVLRVYTQAPGLDPDDAPRLDIVVSKGGRSVRVYSGNELIARVR